MGNTASTSEGVLSAALKGDAAFISERMKESGDAVLSTRTGIFAGKKNLLHVACKFGQHQVIATIINPLLDAVTAEIESNLYPGAATALLDKLINQQDSKGRTALLAACYYGQLECAELLLEAGSNIFACDKDGNGVLHLAAVKGHTNIIATLLAKADAQAITMQLTGAVNLGGFTALHYAAYSGSATAAQQLAVAGVDLLQASWGEYDRWLVVPLGSTALHVAALGLKASACLVILQVHALLAREWLPGSLMLTDPRSKTTIEGHNPYDLAIWKGMPASCQLATVLNPRVAFQAVVQQERLQELAQLRRKGPVSLRVIAAEAAKQHLLRQLEALAKQHQHQKKLQEQQLLLQQLHHHHKQQQQHRRQHSEHSHHSLLHRSTNSKQQLVAMDLAGPDSSRGSSATPTPEVAGSAAAAANCSAAELSSMEARGSTLCSSASSCSKPCIQFADAAAAVNVPAISLTSIDAAAAHLAAAAAAGGQSLLPGAISGHSLTAAATNAAAGGEHATSPGRITDRPVQQIWQQQEHVPATARACNRNAATCCEIEAAPDEQAGNYCMVEVLTQSTAHEKGKFQQDDDDAAALLLHMLSPGSLVTNSSSCGTSSSCSSSSALVSAHRQYVMQHRRSSEPAIEEGNEAEATATPYATAAAAPAAAVSVTASPQSPKSTKALPHQDSLQHPRMSVPFDRSILSNTLSSSSGMMSLWASSNNSSSSSRSLQPRKSSFRSIPQLDLSRISRGPNNSAASGSALFSANREQYARMMQEAQLDDPRTLSYRALARHSRTGSMTAATALAGALPGCISDRLAHCYDNSSFILTTTINVSGGNADTTRIGNGVSSKGLCASLAAGSAVGGTVGSTIGGAIGSTIGKADQTRRISAASSVACGEVCAVCMDKVPTVNITACGHELCHECAKCIVGEGVGCRPPLCPFCRQVITGFGLVAIPMPSYTGRHGAGPASAHALGMGLNKVAAALDAGGTKQAVAGLAW